ncbi:carboxypeptidase-like regulatory domain-containing protein [Spirosoma fluviale]|uniref:CarboxypepD_reg-like domain-containing protein n=1 Tax=Spirosoma fluviale TaxID=1597977 RepID=A0A286GVR0_9BACT|nr:carboxypeptidase-like regulatory domain-containing protein [Spirosoma fluviale]SOD99618.1 CarboxypepD_reg-like domain-containing protein [Spirosoma fluviale]
MKFLLLVCLLSASVHAQTITGRVIDGQTQARLPFASISIAGTKFGTTANGDGLFSINISKSSGPVTLLVSYLGYRTKSEVIASSASKETIMVRLAPIDKTLKEVTVMPDSSLRVLLKRAYDRIEQNYPTHPIAYQLFYRESLKTPDNRYVFAGEALMKGYITGYQNTVEDGQVELQKVRISRFAGGDSLTNVVFYGGPFCFAADDIVKRRFRFLKGDMSRYRYQLVEETLFDGRPTYVVSFERKQADPKNKPRGVLHIDKETLAYRFIERMGREDSTSLNSRMEAENQSRAVYRLLNGKWYMQYITVQATSRRTTKKVLASVDLVVTDLDTANAQPIPYAKRLAYGDFFYNLPNNYSTSFWDEFTTLVPETTLGVSVAQAQALATNVVVAPAANVPVSTTSALAGGAISKKGMGRRLLIHILTHLETLSGLRYVPFALGNLPESFGLTYVPAKYRLRQQENARLSIPIYATSGLGYTINKWWSVGYRSSAVRDDEVFSKSKQLTTSSHLLLKRRGNPVFLKPTIGYYWQTDLRSAGQIGNTTRDVTVGNRSFRTDQIDLSLGSRSWGILASLKLEKKLKGQTWLYLDTGIKFEQNRKLVIYGREASGFPLFRRSNTNLLSQQATFELTELVQPDQALKNSLYTELGLRFSLF